MTMGRLFGTDGVRGVANRELTPELALALGRAAGHVLACNGAAKGLARPGVIIGRDTRRSGRMLESALAAGLCSVGMEVWLAGVIPTPGLAFLSRLPDFVAGAVISASHNPALDNGIKFFDHEGLKLPDELEEAIEAAMAQDLPRPTEAGIGRVGDRRDLVDLYVGWLIARAPSLGGQPLLLDCANGATFRVAPKVFRSAGADVRVLFAEPDGTNINAGCGSTQPDTLRRAVADLPGAVGFAFDGDGDRVIAVDERGRILHGDALIGVLALELKRRGELARDVVVGTIETNGGLEATLARAAVRVVRAPVGDKYVWEKCVSSGAVLGGEPSGHVILRAFSTAGDGILTALRLLAVMRERGATLAELADAVEIWPQVRRNVPATRRTIWREVSAFYDVYRETEERLNGIARVLVRPSGTEPVLRILVEGRDLTVCESTADRLAAAAMEHLR